MDCHSTWGRKQDELAKQIAHSAVTALRRHLKQERGTEFPRKSPCLGKGVRKILHDNVRYIKKGTKEMAFKGKKKTFALASLA